jgi:DNA-binding CsgD family transcriptional regulator
MDLDESIRLATLAVAAASSMVDRLNGITCAGMAAVLLGRAGEGMAVVELASAYALEVFDTDPAPGGYVAFIYSQAALLRGRIDEAVTVFELLLEQDLVRIGGAAWALPTYLLAGAVMAQGRVAVAGRLCRESLRVLGDDNNYFGSGTLVVAMLATAAGQASDTEAAASALAWLDTHVTVHIESDALAIDLARAWHRAACGELSAARSIALDAAGRAGAAGAWTYEMAALIDAVRLGAPDAAAPRLAELSRIIEGPYVVAAARFAEAVAADDGEGLDDVAARFDRMGARLLAAEAAAAAADAHAAAGRRRDRAASLAQAQQLAARCDGAATPMLARLDRDPLVTALTDREREVIELAAHGRTSREIATALTISIRTVDSHLNHAYTKLGINDRSQLPAVLGHLPRTR